MIQSIFLDTKRYMLLKQDYISDIQEFRTNKLGQGWQCTENCGEYKTSLDIPLKEEELKKMREEKIIEKVGFSL